MVLVFHLNRRLVRYKLQIFFALFALLMLEISYHLVHEVCPLDEPIDVVYTWVNGSDPKFLKELNAYSHGGSDASGQRFDDKDELKFSLRSLEKYAPWIGHVYIVTNGQIPYWLNLDYEKVTLVTHKQIFTDDFDLPTFSSPAIESHLHRIPGLSKRFIYFNDDVFLGAPVYKDDFVSDSRGFLIYLAWLVPPCSVECSWLYVADGRCDSACLNPSCQMDGGDCVDSKPSSAEDQKPNEVTNYEKILSSLKMPPPFPTTLNIIDNLRKTSNLSELIAVHNEKIILLDKLRRRKMRKKFETYYNNNMKNQNVDGYAASLQHTNRMLNNYYGFSVRKVPAHAPIMIDTDLMEDLQNKFRKEYRVTSRNRIRSADDVQYAFAYYYYVIHETVRYGVEEIFDRFDTDQSGFWSETEVRTVMSKLYNVPITDRDLDLFTNLLINCSSNFVITKKLVQSCPPLASVLDRKLAVKRRYKFEIIKEAKHVSFKMLYSNVTQVMDQLDDVRKNTKKFVCLNDNLDQTRVFDNEIIRKLMYDFYMAMFPVQSKFELPEQLKNRFLYMDDYVIRLQSRENKLIVVGVLMGVTMVGGVLHFFRRQVCKMVGRVFC